MDLRAEPIVITMPKIEKGRYYTGQLIDLYTFNFAYLGTRSLSGDCNLAHLHARARSHQCHLEKASAAAS